MGFGVAFLMLYLKWGSDSKGVKTGFGGSYIK